MKESKALREAKEIAQILSPLAESPLSPDDKKYLKAVFTGMALEREMQSMRNAAAN